MQLNLSIRSFTFAITTLVLSGTVFSVFGQQPCNSVYVTDNGSGSVGDITSPTDLLTALSIYQATPARNTILMLAGNYTFSAKIQLSGGVIIEGGYTINSNGEWVKTSNSATVLNINPVLETASVQGITVGHYIGIEAIGQNSFKLKNLTLNVLSAGAVGSTSNRGHSIYAVYTSNCNAYEISSVTINTGAASDGDAGAAVGSTGGAAGGGGGGNGGGFGQDCSNGSGGGGGSAGNGGAGGGNGGGGGNAGGCNWYGCGANAASGFNGGIGSTGAAGTGFVAGNRPASPAASDIFYLPGGAAGAGTSGKGGGGGGGGGGASNGTCCTCGCGSGNGTGGAGGTGGGGGLGGNPGFGGGSTFAVYATGTGTNDIKSSTLTPGAFGLGGNGSNGQPGAAGSPGTAGGSGNRCGNGYNGGTGGTGGTGGDGGRGQDGANGISQGVVTVNGAVINQTGTGVPSGFVLSANEYRGCTNSVIEITTSGGTWNFVSTDPAFVNDQTSTTSSFTNASTTAQIFYTSTGDKDVTISTVTYPSFIVINTSRTLPTINLLPDTICFGDSLNLGTPDLGSTYTWDIADVANPSVVISTFTGQNPGMVPVNFSGGAMQIKLRIKDDCCGWSLPVFKNIFVTPQTPIAFAALAPNFCISDTNSIALSATPSGGTFSGPGVSGSNFVPSLANTGINFIHYTILVNGCNSTGLDTINVIGLPNVNFSGLLISYCPDDTTAYPLTPSPTGGIFSGNGLVDSIFTASVAMAGIHQIRYDYTDPNSGCSNSNTQTAVVNQYPQTLIPGLNSHYCVGESIVTLVGFPGGGLFQVDGNFATQFDPSVVGSHTVTYTYTDPVSTCRSDNAFPVTVDQPIPVNLGADTIICISTSLVLDAGFGYDSYAWSNGLGNGQTATVLGTGAYSVVAIDSNGCSNTDAILVTTENLLQPTITSSGPVTFCSGDTITLDAGPAGAPDYADYLWSDGFTHSRTLTVTQQGIYSVTAWSANGCSGSSADVNVYVYTSPNPTVTSDGPTSFCPSDNVSLCLPTGMVQYQWSNGDTNRCITLNNSTQITGTVTDVNGCSASSAPIQVQVYSLVAPVVTVSGPTEFCIGGSVILDVGQGWASILWSSGNTTPAVTVTQTGCYSVIVMDLHGCIDSSQTTTPICVNVGNPHPLISQSGNILTSEPFTQYQWHEMRFNVYDSTLVGQTAQTYTIDHTSWYYVTATDANGCVGSSDIVNVTYDDPNAKGIEDLFAEGLSIFPNPTTDFLEVSFKNKSAGAVSIYLTDLAGRVVRNMLKGEKALSVKSRTNLSGLNSGSYLLWIEDGEQRIAKKITKE